MKKHNILFTVLIMLFVIAFSIPSSALTVKPATPKDVTVSDPYDGVGFEVSVSDVSGTASFNWVECYKDGMPVDHISLGNGQAFYLHSVPESGKKVYYKCVVTDNSNSKEIIFSAQYKEEIVDIEIIQEPKKKEYKVGEYIDLEGIKVRVLTGMGYRDITDASKFKVSPEKITSTGITHVYVKYEGLQDMYTVTCVAGATSKPTNKPTATPAPKATEEAEVTATPNPYETPDPESTPDIDIIVGPGGIQNSPKPGVPSSGSISKLAGIGLAGLLTAGLIALGSLLLITGITILIIVLCKNSAKKKAAQNSVDKNK